MPPSSRRRRGPSRGPSLATVGLLILAGAVTLLAGHAGAQATAQGQTAPVPQAATVHINFVNADLGDVIRSLAAALGVNMVLTDVPPRRITFSTPQPVATSQAGAILEGILASQGLILVQNGPVTQVLPDDKRPATGPLRVGKTFPDPAPLGLVTQIVPLDFMRADEAVALLHDVADKLARIEVVPRSNAILVTDRGEPVLRMVPELGRVDPDPAGGDVEDDLADQRLERPRAPVGDPADRVGEHRGMAEGRPADPVRPGEVHPDEGAGADRPRRRVGADVLHVVKRGGEDDPLVVERDPGSAVLVPRLPGRHQVLLAILDPSGPSKKAGAAV